MQCFEIVIKAPTAALNETTGSTLPVSMIEQDMRQKPSTTITFAINKPAARPKKNLRLVIVSRDVQFVGFNTLILIYQ